MRLGGQGWQLQKCDQMRSGRSERRGVMAERRKTQEDGEGREEEDW